MSDGKKRRKKGRRKKRGSAVPVIVILLAAVLLGLYGFKDLLFGRFMYSSERADLGEYFGIVSEEDIPIRMGDELLPVQAKLKDGTYYLDFRSVQEYLNDRFYLSESDEEKQLIYTLPGSLVTVYPDRDPSTVITRTGAARTESSQIEDYPIAYTDSANGQTYVALDYVQKYTNFTYEAFTDPGHIQMDTTWGTQTVSTIKKNTELREKGGIKSPILRDLEKGEIVTIMETMETWSKVKTSDSYIGYVENKRLNESSQLEQTPYTSAQVEEYSSIKKDYKINMAWHNVASAAGNSTLTDYLAGTHSLNTISPTWFYLDDNEGTVVSFGTEDYVEQAHGQGLEVWAMFADHINKEMDPGAALSTYEKRTHIIDQIMTEAQRLGIDGINIDFERIDSSYQSGEDYIEFLRELSISCREAGLVLSVDDYAPLSTEYNAQYHRQEQGVVCDYVVIMGYDEHYAGSAEAGSVASIEYVRNGIENMLAAVPAEKVLNGIPFYTRIWTTSGAEVSSQAVDMATANSYIANHGIEMSWNDSVCQNYGEQTQSDGSLVQIWLEDAESIQTKLSVMEAHGLGGVAEWCLNQETDDIWDEIAAYLER